MEEQLRFFIVEDEALILMQLEALVEDAGHLVVGTAMRSDEAIGLALAVSPDIAFVDLSLCDGGSGIDVAHALETMGGVMVIFVTANSLRLDDKLSGAAGVVLKPFTRAVISRCISYLEECVRHPPPVSALPNGMQMAARYLPARHPTSFVGAD